MFRYIRYSRFKTYWALCWGWGLSEAAYAHSLPQLRPAVLQKQKQKFLQSERPWIYSFGALKISAEGWFGLKSPVRCKGLLREPWVVEGRFTPMLSCGHCSASWSSGSGHWVFELRRLPGSQNYAFAVHWKGAPLQESLNFDWAWSELSRVQAQSSLSGQKPLELYEKVAHVWDWFSDRASESDLDWSETAVKRIHRLNRHYQLNATRSVPETTGATEDASEEEALKEELVNFITRSEALLARAGAAYQTFILPCIFTRRIFAFFECPFEVSQIQKIPAVYQIDSEVLKNWEPYFQKSPHRLILQNLTEKALKDLWSSDEATLQGMSIEDFDKDEGIIYKIHDHGPLNLACLWLLFLRFTLPNAENMRWLEGCLSEESSRNQVLFAALDKQLILNFYNIADGFSRSQKEGQESYFGSFVKFIYRSSAPKASFWEKILELATLGRPLISLKGMEEVEAALLLNEQAKASQLQLSKMTECFQKAKESQVKVKAEELTQSISCYEEFIESVKLYLERLVRVINCFELQIFDITHGPIDLSQTRLELFESQCTAFFKLGDFLKTSALTEKSMTLLEAITQFKAEARRCLEAGECSVVPEEAHALVLSYAKQHGNHLQSFKRALISVQEEAVAEVQLKSLKEKNHRTALALEAWEAERAAPLMLPCSEGSRMSEAEKAIKLGVLGCAIVQGYRQGRQEQEAARKRDILLREEMARRKRVEADHREAGERGDCGLFRPAPYYGPRDGSLFGRPKPPTYWEKRR